MSEKIKVQTPVVLGHIGDGKHQSNVLYSPYGLCPTLDTVHGLAIVKVLVKDDREQHYKGR